MRCVYHGWKYDVNGNVIETPGEPPGSQLCLGMRHTAYPCIEVNRLIYTYMARLKKNPFYQPSIRSRCPLSSCA